MRPIRLGLLWPLREAIGRSGLLRADKRSYYLDPSTAMEAVRACGLDVEEGAEHADVTARPAISRHLQALKDTYGLPTFAYQVSAYSMIRLEACTRAIRRATRIS